MEFYVPTRRVSYYCPYCDGSQWLLSWRPVLTDRWVCTKCDRRFLLDTAAVMHALLNTITLWAVFPIALLLAVFFALVTRRDKLILALLIGVPVFTVAVDVVLYVVCIPVVWVIARQIKGSAEGRGRNLKVVRREVS
jgi:hypothetical protein